MLAGVFVGLCVPSAAAAKPSDAQRQDALTVHKTFCPQDGGTSSHNSSSKRRTARRALFAIVAACSALVSPKACCCCRSLAERTQVTHARREPHARFRTTTGKSVAKICDVAKWTQAALHSVALHMPLQLVKFARKGHISTTKHCLKLRQVVSWVRVMSRFLVHAAVFSSELKLQTVDFGPCCRHGRQLNATQSPA